MIATRQGIEVVTMIDDSVINVRQIRSHAPQKWLNYRLALWFSASISLALTCFAVVLAGQWGSALVSLLVCAVIGVLLRTQRNTQPTSAEYRLGDHPTADMPLSLPSWARSVFRISRWMMAMPSGALSPDSGSSQACSWQ